MEVDIIIKVLSFFSGIGSPEKALTNLKVDFKIIGFSEVDKFAIRNYSKIHNINEKYNLGDIRNIQMKYFDGVEVDLLIHGSPCQSFSIRGNQAGGDKGSGTSSSLMWNTVEIIEKVKPKIIVWENVKNVLSKRHKHNFEDYLNVLDMNGYNNYYKILNAADYGTIQNRERIFVVSIRKDIDNLTFKFPKKIENHKKLSSVLEKRVDDRYYLSKDKIDIISQAAILKNNFVLNTDLGYVEKKYIEFICEYGYIPKFFNPYNKKEIKNILPTFTTTCGSTTSSSTVLVLEGNPKKDNFKIRRLTPKERLLIMGFSKKDYLKIKGECSDTQLYKQIGNSITVNVMEELFKEIIPIFDINTLY